MINNLKALSGRAVVIPLEEHYSELIHLPANRIERGGSLIKCHVISSGIDDLKEGQIAHCRAELGYRVPMSSCRIYMQEDVLLIED